MKAAKLIAALIVLMTMNANAQITVTPGADMPRIHIFLPDSGKATGRAVVILPGGGYAILSTENEGTGWAPFFNQLGIAVAVVEYSMPGGDRTLPISDALKAMSHLRANADSLGINPHDIGIMGFSAGGHLASTIATQAPDTLRPDFQILFYPVISMTPELAHRGSHDNLLGAGATPELERAFSSELQVDSLTPPAFIALSDDDRGVKTANSTAYYNALHHAGIPASLHIYPTGGHGWGISSCPWKELMLSELSAWLRWLPSPTR